ncbi:MAG: CNNM domain-containing protein [Pirellulaceae bacterium]|nr:CNNM domain-containing protein [Pirellulaceae bacterium]
MTFLSALLESAPLLFAMTVLIGFSAFFSASEAALFSLRAPERSALKNGNRAQRLAADLLEDPDRLLTAVLFWNLLVNIVYFALASLVGFRLDKVGVGKSALLMFTVGALLSMIFLSEMLPKSFAVLKARAISALISVPLSAAVKVVDPLMPTLRVINLLSRRLIWPTFEAEPYLEVTDLARAIEISTDNAELIEQERNVLRNVVSLSDLRADECMRPRSLLVTFRPPVSLASVRKKLPPSGYLFITEMDSDEIVSALELRSMFEVHEEHLERYAQPAVYVPWCTTVADVLQRMETSQCDVAVIVNELGETIGVMTRRDILDVAFTTRSSRSERILKRQPIEKIAEALWQVSGLTNLRALEEFFQVELPDTSFVTVAGVVQESLQRMPEAGDQCEWGPFSFQVVQIQVDGQIAVELTRVDEQEGQA